MSTVDKVTQTKSNKKFWRPYALPHTLRLQMRASTRRPAPLCVGSWAAGSYACLNRVPISLSLSALDTGRSLKVCIQRCLLACNTNNPQTRTYFVHCHRARYAHGSAHKGNKGTTAAVSILLPIRRRVAHNCLRITHLPSRQVLDLRSNRMKYNSGQVQRQRKHSTNVDQHNPHRNPDHPNPNSNPDNRPFTGHYQYKFQHRVSNTPPGFRFQTHRPHLHTRKNSLKANPTKKTTRQRRL